MRFALFLALLAPAVCAFTLPRFDQLYSWFTGNAAASPTEGPVVLSLMDDVWATPVSVGGSVLFNVAIDTISGFLWVPDTNCTNCHNVTDYYDSFMSPTYRDTGANFSTQSQFGHVQGEIGRDTVILGGVNSSMRVTIPRATFGQVERLGKQLPAGIDGILGLAFQSTAPNGAQPVLETALRENAVTAGIFVIWLEDQYATSDNGSHGVIYYGDNDPLHCKLNQRHIYPLSNAHYYQFTVPSVTVGTYQYRQRTQAIIDAMSPYIAGPGAFVDGVLQHLGINRNAALPAKVNCNLQVDVAFNFQLGTEHVTQLNLVYKKPDGTCVLGLIRPVHGNQEVFELGYSFLRGRCTFFDYQDHRIGFSDALTHGSEHAFFEDDYDLN